MRKISVSDITMKLASADGLSNIALSFRQKLELAKSLDRLGVSVIETHAVVNGKKDILLIKSLASAVKESTLCVPMMDSSCVSGECSSVDEVWDALKEARHPRLQVSVPVSTVQMEYIYHKKPAAIEQLVGDMVAKCAALCSDVEFVAEDFGRSDREFLLSVVRTAVGSGATTITISDTAGTLLGEEFFALTQWIRKELPENIRLGVWCSNDMFMADSCAVAAVCAGADEVKTTPYGNCTTSLKRFMKILSVKQDMCNAYCDVKMTELQRAVEQIKAICYTKEKGHQAGQIVGQTFDDDELTLSNQDNRQAVMDMVSRLGYDLDEEDEQRVYDAFLIQASKNETVTARELDAIVATVAFQAPVTYRLDSYLINSGNNISATCHMKLRKNEEVLEGVSLGDGPVDAAFLAIEKLVGRSYELDDFQIQSVTQGSKAMGGAVVRLRHEGKIFSGRGISTDIVEAGIMAYLNAMNKIAFEENE